MRGSTLDLRVLDVSARWQKHQSEGSTLPRAATLNQEDMLKMLKQAQQVGVD